MINQLLTTPRPGGPGVIGQAPNAGAALSGMTPAGSPNNQQQVVGAGIAGVASKREQEGIKSYGSRTKYNEWEFVYDLTKDPRMGRGGAMGGTGAQMGAQGAAGRGATGSPLPNPTGTIPPTQ